MLRAWIVFSVKSGQWPTNKILKMSRCCVVFTCFPHLPDFVLLDKQNVAQSRREGIGRDNTGEETARFCLMFFRLDNLLLSFFTRAPSTTWCIDHVSSEPDDKKRNIVYDPPPMIAVILHLQFIGRPSWSPLHLWLDTTRMSKPK